MRLISHCPPKPSEVFVDLQNPESKKYLRFWIPSDLVHSLVRDVHFIQAWSLLGVVKNCQTSMDIREEYRFLARE